MLYRIAYDMGRGSAHFDAIPYTSIGEALAQVRCAIDAGAHTTAIITVTSGEGPDVVLAWSEVQLLLRKGN